MAQNDINVGLNVTSNGTIKKENEDAQKLAATLRGAEKAASGTSKALNSAKTASSSAARSKAPTLDENLEYGITRASVGTGAASRDFAKQSQGLGGLVRLYATFAANIFALTAAFTALSSAADTSNLVKGLDQLGAASGRALGTLSKQLADASEGAISLRDSMESVAKASSAGLSNKQIIDLGNSARQASQALGLSMPDALNRLTRGIAKLEPELLDELGIFVRIDDVTRKYALTMGKAATSLTDFERRQAFANAVLDQAKEKFGEIKLDVNPYSKLLASFQNITYEGLNLVNKVLGPLVKLLAENPTGFSAVLAVITAKLLSSAIPALGEWRNGLKSAAEEASKTADAISRSFGDEFQGRLEASFRLPGLEKNLAAANKRVSDIKRTMEALPATPTSLANTKFPVATNDEKGFNAVNKALTDRQAKLDAVAASQRTMSAKVQADTQKEIEFLKAKQASIVKNIELRKAEMQAQQAALALESANNRALTAASKEQGRWDTERIALGQAQKARLDYDKIAAISHAAETTRILGVRLAWQALNNEIADKGIKGIDRFTTLAKGGLVSVGTRIVGIVGSLADLLPVLGTAFVAYELASSILSDNGKEVATFNSSVEDTRKATETLNATFDKISKKDPLASISLKSIEALSTALMGVSDSLESLVQNLDKANKTASGFDKFIDGALTVIGKDLRTKFTKELGFSVSEAFKNMPEGDTKDALNTKLKSILGITSITFEEIQASMDKLDPSKLIEISKLASNAQKAASTEFKESSQQAQAFSAALEDSVQAYQAMSNSLASSDPITKLGLSLVNSGTQLDKVLSDAKINFASLADILGDTRKLSLLPEDSTRLLLKYSDSIRDTQGNIQNYTNQIAEAKKQLIDLQKAQEESLSTDAGGNTVYAINTEAQQSKVSKDIENYSLEIKKNQAIQQSIVADFITAGTEVFKRGIDLLNKQVVTARQQAALTVLKAQTQSATGFAKNSIDANIQKQEINIQLKLITVQEQLVLAQTRTNLLLTENTLYNKKRDLENTIGPLSPEQEKVLKSATEELPYVTEALETLTRSIGKIDFSKMSPRAYGYIGGVAAQLTASNAQRIGLGAQKQAVDITRRRQDLEEERANTAKSAKAKEDALNVYKERLVLLSSILGIENTVALKDKHSLANKVANLEVDRERKVLLDGISDAVEIQSKVNNADDKKAAEKQVKALKDQLANYDAIAKSKKEQVKLSQDLELVESKYAKAVRDSSNAESLRRAESNTRVAQLEATKEQLDYLIKIKAISEEEGIKRTANLEKQLLLQKQLQDEDSIKTGANTERAEINKTADKARLIDPSVVGIDIINKQQAADLAIVNALEAERLKTIKEQYGAKLALISTIAKEEEQYAKISTIGDTIAKAFEGVGESAAKFGSGISNILKTFSTIGTKRVAMEKDTQKKLAAVSGDSAEDAIEYYNIQAEAAKKTKEFEIEALSEQAGAAKSLFSEKTFAYKAFAAVEKAIHVAKLVMMAQEMAASLATVGPVVASEGAKSAAKGKGAILSALNAPFPINFVAGALMAAIVASLIGGGGSKGVSIPSGVSAKDVQETQGTGTSYVNGKKVENGGGVFGDSGAKSESIAKSLEILKDNSIDGLTYNNKMISLLEKINVGINGAAQTLYSIPGIRTGSQFGTEEGTNSSGIKGLFGKSVTKDIADSGIKITGLFTDILNNAANVVKGYETVSTTTKKSGLFGIGGSTKTSIDTQFKALDSGVTQAISEVFSNATDLFIDVGAKLGQSTEDVLSKLGTIRVDQLTSLKGLQGKELEDELNAVLSNILDSASTTLFGALDKYKKFGEGMLETAVRVIDSNEKIKLAFTSITKPLDALNFDVTTALGAISGGLGDFLDSVSSYKETFLTEAEQLVPIQKDVTNQLTNLGFASVKTVDDFKYLVNSLDVTSIAGQETFTALLKLSDAFSRVNDAVEATDNLRIDLLEAEGKTAEATALRRAKELKQMSATDAELQKRIWLLEDEKSVVGDTYSYEYKILQLLGKSSQALALARSNELEALDPQLHAVQKYIYAIEDEITAREKATSGIEKTISSFKNSLSSLKELRSTLLGGDKSVLTPQEKYAQAKQEALAVIDAASAPASSIEDILVRDQAISKLPQVTNTWLESSRNLFASSENYTRDFNTVLSALDNTSAFLDSQLSDAEKQLQAIKDSSNILSAIDDNTLRTSDLLNQFLVAAEATRVATATIPVLSPVVTTTPGAVVDSSTTINQELVAELIKFNKEALEKQLKAQEEATAAIIKANAIAEAANAAALIAAQREAAEQAEWVARNTPVIDYSYNPGGY